MTILKPSKLKLSILSTLLGLLFMTLSTNAIAQPTSSKQKASHSVTHKSSKSAAKKKSTKKTTHKATKKSAKKVTKKATKKATKKTPKKKPTRNTRHITKKPTSTPSLLSTSFREDHAPQLELDPRLVSTPFTPSSDIQLSQLTSVYAKKGSFHKENIQNILAKEALSYLGIRYKYGGTSPKQGFDCSGLIYYIAKNNNISIPRTAAGLATQGEKISKNNLQEGDLVFFNTSGRRYSHVGIYLGDGQFVHAPRKGRNVTVSDLNNSYWKKHYTGARRISQFK